MLFNVAGLIQEGIGATRRYRVEDNLLTEDHDPEPVSGEVELLRTKDGILVRASLQLEEPETCSRCLKPVEETVKIEFEEEFRTTADVQDGEPLVEDPDIDAFLVDEHNLLDLTEAVRQYREASEEMQPLCKEDCLGLCPRCGADLNEGECYCDAGPRDERWSALTALLTDKDERE